jgi:hypothetical protein
MSTTTKSQRLGLTLLFALLSPAAVVAACSSNSNPQPSPVYTVGDSGVGADSAIDSGQGAPLDGSLDADAQPTSLDATPEDAAACTSDAGCWTCAPATPSQFLNQCTASQCSPFVNAQRLPDYDGGLLPLN